MLLGIIAAKLRLSPIIGYLLAGVMLGFFSSVRENRAVISDFAEIGVVLMMFGIGLKFHVDELLSVWKVAVPGAIIQCTFTTIAAGYLFHIYGQSWPAAIMSGMAICVASTVVMAGVLADTRDLHTQVGHITIGWAVVEDILTVMALPVQVEDGAEIIRRAKPLNPKIKVIARRDFFRGANAYKLAGADAVAIGEAELANIMAEKIGELMPKD